jgi:alkylation response protein AidB-like acyl-CoA dehydrogenase
MPVNVLPADVLTPSQAAFRSEVRGFLRSARVTASIARARRSEAGQEAGLLDVYRWLGERGLLAPHWPAEYGGLGLGAIEAAVVTEEMCLAGVPDDAHVLSIDIVGTFLLHAGTQDQRRELLPPLARGERIAAVLLTEPDCGSDLSRLTTRAEPTAGGWRLHGIKVYNQKTQFADFALCAARTSPGQVPFHGITLFVLPLRSPGIGIKPIANMTDDRFHEVVIDGVVVTPADVVGTVDEGWSLINEMLVYERTGIDFHAKSRRWLDSAAAAATASRMMDSDLAGRFAVLDARLRAGQAFAWRIIAALDAGTADPALAAMAKWYVTEQARDVVRFCLEVEGMSGILTSADPDAADAGLVATACRYAPTQRLGSGTSEVMLYIAASALGLL